MALEEYKAPLRAEIVDAMQGRRTISQLRIAGISVLVGLGAQRLPSLIGSLVVALLVPAAGAFVTTAVWGEMLRAARASASLAGRGAVSTTRHSRPTERIRMSDQAPRLRMRGWITPAVLLALAALAAAAALVDLPVQPGRAWWPVAIMLGCAAAAVAAWGLRRRPAASTTPVEIEPSLAAAVRAERERAGEVAAVRMLRTEQPELPLLDAVQLVRNL